MIAYTQVNTIHPLKRASKVVFAKDWIDLVQNLKKIQVADQGYLRVRFEITAT